MNRENIAIWVDALKSGEYMQGKDNLSQMNKLTNKDSFCCLCVACEVYMKKGNDLPKRVMIFCSEVDIIHYGQSREYEYLPKEVSSWLELNTDEQKALAKMNDDGQSFEIIADTIVGLLEGKLVVDMNNYEVLEV